ncbi:MAG: hypothetical protein COV99_04595 [Bacteroidetes bacterium CG12_big_fil_rev_8_21_14_0_65_60_17]|nr:MAG: hypothetical protein COV99_04595 [Bacteroidetes bacterium CG12_big_fil_rev_8_21_14_0_65_60_17]
MTQYTTQSQRPQVTERQVMELVRRWGWSHIESARPIEGDRDSNWRLDGERKGPVAMLKVCSPQSSDDDVQRMVMALQAVRKADLPVPEVLRPSPRRVTIGGAERRVVATSWIEGRKLAHARPILAEHAQQVGRLMARVTRALSSAEGQTANPFAWNLLHADRTLERHLHLIEDDEARKTIEEVLAAYRTHTQSRLASLPRQIIHNDANDHNILVGEPGADGMAPVAGLIDFGDCVIGPRVVDLAVAAAYLALGRTDPVAAVREVAAAWHREWPLTEEEIELIPWIVRTRLAVSVVMSAYQRSLEPENEYLSVSERPAWTLLRQLGGEPAALNIFVMRGACGLEPVPGADTVRRFVRECSEKGHIHPVIRPAVPGLPPVVFDFSVGSLEFRPRDLTVPGLAEDEIWRRAGDAVGIGRYGEYRLAYTGVQFATDWGEMRTLHVGIDLFRPAGTPVHAPLGGRIHSKRIHEEAFDYGGVIILEHETGGSEIAGGDKTGGQRFWTLYGHLSHESVLACEVGQEVTAGEAFAALGAFDENGGWVPHLHMQLITDMLERHATFPGVAPPSRENVWRSLCPDPSLLTGAGARAGAVKTGAGRDFSAPSPVSTGKLLERRRRVLGPNLSLAYDVPRHIVRGYMQYLYEPTGRAYLDAVNNVPHVGHQNDRVVEAVTRQYRALNTNTRYLHTTVLDFAERLAATLPDGLDVVYVVNSGSEANDLALRMARTATGRQDTMVLDGAYHGHLTSLIGISPYKFDGPGGSGRPPGTHVVPMPDAFRGPFRGMTAETGAAYADTIRDALEQAAKGDERAGEGRIAAFIAESVPGCGGQIVPPPGYFKAAAAHVRRAGGLFIADEVQIGLGRAGTAFWGFELQDVVPDIVVVGKPIGNGQPLAAVVTTRAIADAFDNGMEYFNTFGGNPVSAAAGLAVLDELESKGLQEHARIVGGKLLADLRGLAPRHEIMGDVRGTGLFIGVELVRPGGSLAPLRAAARYAVDRLADEGVFTSTDGPDGNVIKIKPPMVFTEQNAEYLVMTLDRILGEDACLRSAITTEDTGSR